MSATFHSYHSPHAHTAGLICAYFTVSLAKPINYGHPVCEPLKNRLYVFVFLESYFSTLPENIVCCCCRRTKLHRISSIHGPVPHSAYAKLHAIVAAFVFVRLCRFVFLLFCSRCMHISAIARAFFAAAAAVSPNFIACKCKHLPFEMHAKPISQAFVHLSSAFPSN